MWGPLKLCLSSSFLSMLSAPHGERKCLNTNSQGNRRFSTKLVQITLTCWASTSLTFLQEQTSKEFYQDEEGEGEEYWSHWFITQNSPLIQYPPVDVEDNTAHKDDGCCDFFPGRPEPRQDGHTALVSYSNRLGMQCANYFWPRPHAQLLPRPFC